MKERRAYPDIGELGWSLYLSAHLRWLKKHTCSRLLVFTLPDRGCLYKDIVDWLLYIPWDFYGKFKGERNRFGLYPSTPRGVRAYFESMLRPGYTIPEKFKFDGNLRYYRNLLSQTIYESYGYSRKLEGKKRILVFPRRRAHQAFAFRNLSEWFYIGLVDALCDNFPDYEIKTIGLSSGAYDIDMSTHSNYVNGVKENLDLQDVIDECQLTVAAIGGASSLPKISALQGVPTFIVGHEKKRCMEDENWLKTKMGFYEVAKNGYGQFDFKECINRIISFVKGCQ